MRSILIQGAKKCYFAIEFFCGFVTIYLLVFIGGGLIPIGELEENGSVSIYVKSNGVHTDICIPTESAIIDWKTIIPIEHFPNNITFEYISMGWGDKGFFLDTPEWSDLTFTTAVNAAFLPSPTAMHVEYLETIPKVSDNMCLVRINESNYHNLVGYVKESFVLKNEQAIIIPDKGYWKIDNFYEAQGNYHLFKTCNSWVNRGLKLAGVKTGLFALSSDGVMRHLKK